MHRMYKFNLLITISTSVNINFRSAQAIVFSFIYLIPVTGDIEDSCGNETFLSYSGDGSNHGNVLL